MDGYPGVYSGFEQMKKTIFALAMAGTMMPAAAFAQDSYDDQEGDYISGAENKSGVRIEGRVLYERLDDPVLDEGVTYEFGNGIGFGVEAGYDFPVGETITAGPYFTYDFSSLETCEDNACFAAPEYWAAGLQVGFATGESGLLYGKLGYGQQTVTLQGTIDDPFDPFAPPLVFDERETKGGYNFAFGYEHGFGETIYARGEFGVSESYDIYGFDLQRGLFALSLGARF